MKELYLEQLIVKDDYFTVVDFGIERCRYTLYGHTDSVNSIEFFPYSNTLLTGSADKSLSIWDARTGKCEQSLYGHMHSINDATFTPRGHMIASCDACGVTKLWDFRKLLPMVSIDVGPSPGNEVTFDSSVVLPNKHSYCKKALTQFWSLKQSIDYNQW
ncbi:hypothetical protein MG293_004675 [Ovis ammon polii]|uniref:Sperm-associated antigen 16 protein n=1 Tax=Ovis ammon polii TaxID=230172 RepID=A0AAD4UGS2_OVIAM|nr:hypothetical protein MG293_004675 [Ovis ammon polii]KAI4574761.1 hypothetical protein MJT46_004040 [Ovis ammon polii x Ovis aries]